MTHHFLSSGDGCDISKDFDYDPPLITIGTGDGILVLTEGDAVRLIERLARAVSYNLGDT